VDRSLIVSRVRSVKQGDTLDWSAVSAAPSASTTADADVALARLCGSGDAAACEYLVDQYQ